MVRKKLIEVDLPLDAINAESKREKSIWNGYPSTIHHWWARRPLAACRAVIFASMVDDPSSCPEEFPTEEEQKVERQRLHDIIREIIKWENTDERKADSRSIQNKARYEIARSVARLHGEMPPKQNDTTAVLEYLRGRAPPVHDPFAGGGSIPLEAQRLGLNAVASDLNPVAVLINKALIDLPSKFSNKPPTNPNASDISDGTPWSGATGLASDIRYYGRHIHDEAFKIIGHLYPKIQLPGGGEATVTAWLWARTIPCPNPACRITMPLISSFQLSQGSTCQHWTRPIVDMESKTISFVIQNHNKHVPKQGTVNRNGASCLACNTISPLSYVREQGRSGNMGEQMIAIVAMVDRKKLFLSPTEEHIQASDVTAPNRRPIGKLPERALGFRVGAYGFAEWHELFTDRQLTALTTFSDLTKTLQQIMKTDKKYVDCLCTFISLALGKYTNKCSSFSRWQKSGSNVVGVFSRQALSMMWDYAETNPFSTAPSGWMKQVEWVASAVENLPPNTNTGEVYQANAVTIHDNNPVIVVTDPPYYDNIGYADLSDFFYVWHRPLLHKIYPELFAGILTPKEEEMVASPRFLNSGKRFEKLIGDALQSIRKHTTKEFPSCIFYAYKQEEENRGGRASTGWETMLSAIVSTGFQIVGTWPIRTELQRRLRSQDSNALSTSVVLVCRLRPDDASVTTRRQFVEALRLELPIALTQMQLSNVAPVDLAQSAIGPGMAIFTRYSQVLDTSGNTMSVREALTLINQTMDEVLAEQEGDFDADTRWALSWFTQFGFGEKVFGDAETLAKAKNTSVSGMVEAGILESGAGKVRLLRPIELPGDWDPKKDKRFTIWEATHHMVRVLDQGEEAAADMMANIGSTAKAARELAYHLYHTCEQKNYSREAQDYNTLVQSWPEISRLAKDIASRQESQTAGLKMYDDR